MKPFKQILDNLDNSFFSFKYTENITKDSELGTKNRFIVQHNSLVEARYRLSLQEKRVILWLLTQIKPEDKDFNLHKLEIVEFAKMTGLKSNNQYSKLQEVTLNLMKRVIKIDKPENKTILQIAWLSCAEYHLTKGYVDLGFDPRLRPYLLQLKSHFTKLTLSDMMQLNSIYSIRIYELLKQYQSIGKRKTSIQNLRECCGIDEQEYKKYNNFKKDVLERAKAEISAKTDIEIDYLEIKESRKIVSIEWIITKKDLEKEKHLEKIDHLEKEIRSEQTIINNLLEYGFGKTLAKRFISMHGEETIKNAIRVVNLQIERGKAKNPKAMLKVGIEEKWHPEIFKTKKKK